MRSDDIDPFLKGPVPKKDRTGVKMIGGAVESLRRRWTNEAPPEVGEELPEIEDTGEYELEDFPQSDPYSISQRLRALIQSTYELQTVGEDIRNRIMRLVEVLETRDFSEEDLSQKTGPLIFGKHNRGIFSRMGINADHHSRKPRTADLPQHQSTMEIMNAIQTEALRALSIICPIDDPMFELWRAEHLEYTKQGGQNSVAEDALSILGRVLAGKRIYTDELVAKLEEMRGEKIGKDTFNNALRTIRSKTKGTRFELRTGNEPRPKGGRRHFHWININEGDEVDEELLRQKIWAAKMAIPGKSGDREENMRIITDKPTNTPISTKDLVKERGLEKLWETDIERARNKIHRSMSAVIGRIETSDIGSVREFTIRRIREGGGSQVKVSYLLMDRAESIETWLQAMSAQPGGTKDRVLRKMLGYKLDREFTTSELVELLAEDGFTTNRNSVSKILSEALRKSKGTIYELEAKRAQHHAYYKIKI
jgi:hypothetical protein